MRLTKLARHVRSGIHSIRTRLILSYLAIALLPLAILGWLSVKVYLGSMTERVRDYSAEVVNRGPRYYEYFETSISSNQIPTLHLPVYQTCTEQQCHQQPQIRFPSGRTSTICRVKLLETGHLVMGASSAAVFTTPTMFRKIRN